ncbi:hypothetical protein AB1E18_003575 [Capra hircus]
MLTSDQMVQKVSQEAAIFSNLDPATVYAFSIRTEKEGFKDSSPYIKEIQTAPSAVEFVNHSRNSNAVTISWPSARSLLDGYIISISSESLMKEEILPSTKRTFTFNRLSPGTDFLISIIATKGLKRSHPTVLMVSTLIVYTNKAKVKNLTPGVDYVFHVKTVRGKDYSVSVMKNVATKLSM